MATFIVSEERRVAHLYEVEAETPEQACAIVREGASWKDTFYLDDGAKYAVYDHEFDLVWSTTPNPMG